MSVRNIFMTFKYFLFLFSARYASKTCNCNKIKQYFIEYIFINLRHNSHSSIMVSSKSYESFIWEILAGLREKLCVIDHEMHKEAQSPMKLAHIGHISREMHRVSRGWHIKNEIIAITSDGEYREVTHTPYFGKCIAGTLHRHLFGSPPRPRRYKVSPVPPPHRVHYHEPTIITVARLAVINHATGMIRLNCCSHVSALEACRAWVVAWSEKRCRGEGWEQRGESGVAEGERGRVGCATFPHHADDEDRHRREAMSVTSGNYARVPVAIGLLILLGARWESVCCSRCDSPWLVADNTAWRLRQLRDGSGLRRRSRLQWGNTRIDWLAATAR